MVIHLNSSKNNSHSPRLHQLHLHHSYMPQGRCMEWALTHHKHRCRRHQIDKHHRNRNTLWHTRNCHHPQSLSDCSCTLPDQCSQGTFQTRMNHCSQSWLLDRSCRHIHTCIRHKTRNHRNHRQWLLPNRSCRLMHLYIQHMFRIRKSHSPRLLQP